MAGLLPNTHAELMEPGKSGISDAFPDKFQIDMDGKNWEWEAVVLIPFLDEARLMDETSRINASALTPQQRARNEHGLNKRYMYQPHAPLETPLGEICVPTSRQLSSLRKTSHPTDPVGLDLGRGKYRNLDLGIKFC